MKVRNGFVSNSSSSSFVVIMKNGQDLTYESLISVLDINEKSPLFTFAKDLAKWTISNTKKHTIEDIFNNYYGRTAAGLTEDQMIDEILKEFYGDKTEYKNILEKIKNGKFCYYEGRASNDSGYALEYYLYDNGLNVDTENIKITCRG